MTVKEAIRNIYSLSGTVAPWGRTPFSVSPIRPSSLTQYPVFVISAPHTPSYTYLVKSLIEHYPSPLLDLCRKYDVRRLDLIGSALRNYFDPSQSALDFVVEFNNFDTNNAADRYLALLVDLEDLFARRIDLVSYRAIRNP